MTSPNNAPLIDPDRLLEAVRSQEFGTENPGFCIECGEERGECEPDACKYECYACGASAVYGAQELLLMGYA